MREPAPEFPGPGEQPPRPTALAFADRGGQRGEGPGDERHRVEQRRLVVRQPVPPRDPPHLGRDAALHGRRQVGEEVVLDVRVEAAVEDAHVGAVLERHLLGEHPLDVGVELGAGQEVPGRPDLALVVLVGGLLGAGVGEELELAGVVFDKDEEQHRHVAAHPAEVVGEQGRQCAAGAGLAGAADVALERVPGGDRGRRAQRVRAEEAVAVDAAGHVGQEERRGLRGARGQGRDDRHLAQVVAVPLLAVLPAQQAVAEVVVLAHDVGVGVVPGVVHGLPVVHVHVEVPAVATRVVLAVVRQVVVAAVDDVVAELGELQEPVQRLEQGGAAHGAGAALAQQLPPARVDRAAVGGDAPDVRQVGLADLVLGAGVERLEVVREARDGEGAGGGPGCGGGGGGAHDGDASHPGARSECPFRAGTWHFRTRR